MPKKTPKQKQLSSKKKMPMSILGLLGVALLLVGIVAAIGLTQINQDSRSDATDGGSNPGVGRQKDCSGKTGPDFDKCAKENIAIGWRESGKLILAKARARKAAEAARDKQNKIASNKNNENNANQVDLEKQITADARARQESQKQAQEQAAIDAQREGERKNYAKEAEKFKTDAAKEAAKAAEAELKSRSIADPAQKAQYTAVATQALAQQAVYEQKAAEAVAASQRTGSTTTSSGGSTGGSSGSSSSTGSIAPINMRVECSSDNKSATIRWDVKSKASTFFVAVDKLNSCDSPLDGWRCPGDFVKTVNCTALSCSYKFKVDKGPYGTVAITAIKGDQRVESKLTKGFACRY